MGRTGMPNLAQMGQGEWMPPNSKITLLAVCQRSVAPHGRQYSDQAEAEAELWRVPI